MHMYSTLTVIYCTVAALIYRLANAGKTFKDKIPPDPSVTSRAMLSNISFMLYFLFIYFFYSSLCGLCNLCTLCWCMNNKGSVSSSHLLSLPAVYCVTRSHSLALSCELWKLSRPSDSEWSRSLNRGQDNEPFTNSGRTSSAASRGE